MTLQSQQLVLGVRVTGGFEMLDAEERRRHLYIDWARRGYMASDQLCVVRRLPNPPLTAGSFPVTILVEDGGLNQFYRAR